MKAIYEFRLGHIDLGNAREIAEKSTEEYARDIALRGKQILEEQFATQGTSEGPWAELAESTVERKGHDLILFETGNLWASPFVRKEFSGNWVFGVESDKFDPGLHERGFINARTGRWVPARPMVGPAMRQVQREMVKIVEKPQETFMKRMRGFIG